MAARRSRASGRRRRHSSGISLTEALVTTAIMAVMTGLGLQSFSTLRTQQQVAQAAAAFEIDVMHLRSVVAARHTTLRIHFGASGGTTCYVIHDGDAADCRCAADGMARCTPGVDVLRSVAFPAGGRLGVAANVRSMAFEPVHGTTTPTGTVRFTAHAGSAEVRQVVSIMGRVRSCSPGRVVSGFKAC